MQKRLSCSMKQNTSLNKCSSGKAKYYMCGFSDKMVCVYVQDRERVIKSCY
jgi:hypothetical protein